MSDEPIVSKVDGVVMVTVPASIFGALDIAIDLLQREVERLTATVVEQQRALTEVARDNPNVRVNPKLIQPFDAGGKIPTIKAVREMTGLGLKEAKDLVDGWEARKLVVFRSPFGSPF